MSKLDLKLGIAGLGTVGQGVFKIFENNGDNIIQKCEADIKVTAVSARDKSKDRGINTDGMAWYENAADLANDENVNCIVELIGGADGIAYDLCKNSLKNGKHVVTANKAMIAKHGLELAKIAEENNVQLLFEAAVAGGIPIIKTIKEGIIGNKISKVAGILNGTCNFILTAMSEEGRDFNDILKEAQELGYAEADPEFDVEGIDAAHKLTILSSLCFGIKPNFDGTYTEGITKLKVEDIEYAKKLGYKVKLLGVSNLCENGKIEQRVHPCLIKNTEQIANVEGVLGAVATSNDALGNLTMVGAGAGMMQTASSVVADICDVASGRDSGVFGTNSNNLSEANFEDIKEHVSEYYLRFNVKDESGVLSSISSILSEHNIGFEKLHQDANEESKNTDIVIITHNSKESDIDNSITQISKESYINDDIVKIRVEDFS